MAYVALRVDSKLRAARVPPITQGSYFVVTARERPLQEMAHDEPGAAGQVDSGLGSLGRDQYRAETVVDLFANERAGGVSAQISWRLGYHHSCHRVVTSFFEQPSPAFIRREQKAALAVAQRAAAVGYVAVLGLENPCYALALSQVIQLTAVGQEAIDGERCNHGGGPG